LTAQIAINVPFRLDKLNHTGGILFSFSWLNFMNFYSSQF